MTEQTTPPTIATLLGLSPEKLKKHAGLAQGLGIGFCILGILAILLPGVFSLGIELFLGWLLLVGGILQVISALSSAGAKGWWLHLIGGLLAAIVGGLFISNPVKGVVLLTMFLAAMFVVNGITKVMYGLGAKGAPGSSMVIINGVFGVIVGLIVWAQWPSSSAWFIGLLVGIDMLFFGMSLITLSSAVKKQAN